MTSCTEKQRNAASATAVAAANALGAKTVRACDSCLRRRARWYCAADDAFLCQSCDSSVHSANPLASRHQRVRLKTASSSSSSSLRLPAADDSASLPAWLHGLRRKARTPRGLHSKPGSGSAQQKSTGTLLVPDLAASDQDHHSNDEDGAEEEEQLLYRVPIFDPVVAEFCTSSSSFKLAPTPYDDLEDSKAGAPPQINYSTGTVMPQDHVITGTSFLPSDVDLAEFAADVESLLGRGLDDDGGGFCIELGLDGLLDSGKEETSPPDWCGSFDARRVKTEEDEEDEEDPECPSSVSQRDDVDVDNFELSRETLDLNFEHDDSPASGGEEERANIGTSTYDMTQKAGINKISLRLDYKAVIAAWSSQGSPWTTGHRPHLNPDDDAWWPDNCLGTFSSEAVLHNPIYGENMGLILGTQAAGGGNGGREARVSRYREKRRTRLFSKKIRYEVRKLNAEKRPRMKGRFVKRASFAATGAFPF